MTLPIVCGACGAAIMPGTRFCPACGAAVSVEERRSPTRDPLYGRVQRALVREFELAQEIGRGGMAAVYLAHDLQLGRKVAVKVMLPELAYAELMPERFVGEARTAAILDHPNIVPIYRAGESDGVRFFAMRYIDGCSLEQLVRALGQLPIGLACYVLADVARALDFAHNEGVIHRDVKPGNVMLDRRWGRAIVTDFGIARVLDTEHITRSGFSVGTPVYMSPEQCMGEEPARWTDQYALGIVAYQVLTGTTPFTGGTLEIQMGHMREPPRPIRDTRPDCPPDLEATVLRMLAKEADDRWPSLGDAVPSLLRHARGSDAELQAELSRVIRTVVPAGPTAVSTPPGQHPSRASARPTVPEESTAMAPAPLAAAGHLPDTAPDPVDPDPVDPGPIVADAGAPDGGTGADGALDSAAPARRPRRRPRRRLVLVGAVAGVAALMAAAAYVLAPGPDRPAPVVTAALAPPPVAAASVPDTTTSLDSAGGGLAPDSLPSPPPETAASAAGAATAGAPVVVRLRIFLPSTARRGGQVAVGEPVPLHVTLDSGAGRWSRHEGSAVQWRSSDASVISVAGGTVTARRIGRATITATVGAVSGIRELTVVPTGDSSLVASTTGGAPTADDVEAAIDDFTRRLGTGGEAAIALLAGATGDAATYHDALAGWLRRAGRVRVRRGGAASTVADSPAPTVQFAVSLIRPRRLQTDETVTATFRAALARDPAGAWRLQDPTLTRPYSSR